MFYVIPKGVQCSAIARRPVGAATKAPNDCEKRPSRISPSFAKLLVIPKLRSELFRAGNGILGILAAAHDSGRLVTLYQVSRRGEFPRNPTALRATSSGPKPISKCLLAYITGRVDKELLVRNEYLADENRILRAKIKGRLQLLSRSGFRDLGINAVAREAGVDKVLIYRYFGGMRDLLQAYAEEGDFWPTAEELLAGFPGQLPPSNAELAAKLLIEFGRAIRRRPITQEIMRWELLEKNELTDALAQYREEQGMRLIGMVKKTRGLDLQALGSLLSAGQTYLILRAKTANVYNGLSTLGSSSSQTP